MTGVTAAQLHWHLSNMNMISNRLTMFSLFRKMNQIMNGETWVGKPYSTNWYWCMTQHQIPSVIVEMPQFPDNVLTRTWPWVELFHGLPTIHFIVVAGVYKSFTSLVSSCILLPRAGYVHIIGRNPSFKKNDMGCQPMLQTTIWPHNSDVKTSLAGNLSENGIFTEN